VTVGTQSVRREVTVGTQSVRREVTVGTQSVRREVTVGTQSVRRGVTVGTQSAHARGVQGESPPLLGTEGFKGSRLPFSTPWQGLRGPYHTWWSVPRRTGHPTRRRNQP